MTTKSYPKRTEKNVVDSDGTVIFTHGKLTGGSLLTRKKAVEHGKPVIHRDMNKLSVDIDHTLPIQIYILVTYYKDTYNPIHGFLCHL